MKKFDIITILSVLLISVVFYILYFINVDSSGQPSVQISYNKEIIYEKKIDEVKNVKIEIKSFNNLLNLTVKDDNGEVVEFMETEVKSNKNIENTIYISDGSIVMIHANCHTKRCMSMKITNAFPTPIICTNGIIVELVFEDVYDYVHY